MSLRISAALPAVLCFCLTTASAQDELYPPGTLTPNLDLGLQPVQIHVPGKYRSQVPENITLNLPPGFSASVYAAGLSGPRLMAISPDGVLHVCNMRAGQILALPDRNFDGVADEHIVVIDGLSEAHSMAFYKGDLYVAEEHRVIRAIDADGDGLYEDREVLIDNIPWRGFHDTRTLVFDEQNAKAYLSIGSPCDLCRMEEGHQFSGRSTTERVPYHPERGTVIQFNDDGSDRRIFVTGVRNVIGMDFHPVTNELWGNNNGHDWEGRAIPPEWIDIFRDGDFLGYPLVHSHQVWNNFGLEGYEIMLPITHEDTLMAQSQKEPVALVPAHWAPMGIHFYTGQQFPARYRNAAFVAFRAGKAKLSSHPGYKVQALFSEPDGSDAVLADFITGFQQGTTTGSVWGFPVGITSDADGSLYVTSDNRTPLILKITHSQLGGAWEPDLPRFVRLANPVEIRAVVRLEFLAEGGDEPRVTADLSALGGPADLALTPEGDDAYSLDVTLVAGTVGAQDVLIRVEQDFGDRTEVLRFSQTVDVLPPSWSHDLPDALVRGEAVDLQARITIGSLTPDGGPTRVTADLSPLGGPSELVLADLGKGIYSLEADLDGDVPIGKYEILVRFEQEIAGLVHGYDFVHAIVIAPPDLPVLDDVLAREWRFEGANGAVVLGPTREGPVFSGTRSHAVQVEPPSLFSNWAVEIAPPQPVDRKGFVGVRFAFHPGDIQPPSIPVLILTIDGLNLDLVRDTEPDLAIDLSRKEWQVLEVPFTVYDLDNRYGDGLRDQVDFVDGIRLQGNLKGTFYLDDVRVVTSIPAGPPTPTVVAESHDDTRPAEFSLDQNYPNPFNSSTVIRYALSDPAIVDLVVYNTVGQAVARLVAGERGSGRYSVTWDGRADYGQELASGIYLVRLTADTWLGTSVRTRKLLLLR